MRWRTANNRRKIREHRMPWLKFALLRFAVDRMADQLLPVIEAQLLFGDSLDRTRRAFDGLREVVG